MHVAKSTSKGSVDMFPISLRVHGVNLECLAPGAAEAGRVHAGSWKETWNWDAFKVTVFRPPKTVKHHQVL